MNLSALIMEPRPDWNDMGPALPAWFRPALRRVDRRLVLQFMPSRRADAKGVCSKQFPHGVWVICRRMRGSGWLFKQWLWSLTSQNGEYLEPGPDTITLLRAANDLNRRERGDVLVREFDDACETAKRERCEASRGFLKEYIQKLCQKLDIVRSNQVSMCGT